MADLQLIDLFQTLMFGILTVLMIPVVITTSTMLVISILQAMMQIQDQTLPSVIKFFALGGSLYFFGPWMGTKLLETTNLFLDGITKVMWG